MKKKKLLIIDDEKNLVFLLKLNIEKTGKFEVFIASDGPTGIKLAKEHLPDYIICDVLMPGMGGPEVARNLIADLHTKDIPIIFFTALATREEVANKMGVEGKYYMAKPATTEDIITFIETVLPRKAIEGQFG